MFTGMSSPVVVASATPASTVVATAASAASSSSSSSSSSSASSSSSKWTVGAVVNKLGHFKNRVVSHIKSDPVEALSIATVSVFVATCLWPSKSKSGGSLDDDTNNPKPLLAADGKTHVSYGKELDRDRRLVHALHELSIWCEEDPIAFAGILRECAEICRSNLLYQYYANNRSSNPFAEFNDIEAAQNNNIQVRCFLEQLETKVQQFKPATVGAFEKCVEKLQSIVDDRVNYVIQSCSSSMQSVCWTNKRM